MLSRDIPEDWPEKATLRGEEIVLRDALQVLDDSALPDVVVDVPDVGEVRPWRVAGGPVEMKSDDDGLHLVL